MMTDQNNKAKISTPSKLITLFLFCNFTQNKNYFSFFFLFPKYLTAFAMEGFPTNADEAKI
jgi:hypothetical protein